MRPISSNIRLWLTLVLWLLSIAFVGWNKMFRIPKKIKTHSDAISIMGSPETDTIVHRESDRVNLYLSFDDGPTAGSWNLNTISITDSIPINVFLIGKYVFKTDSNWRLFQIYRQNPFVEIGNHSYTHANNHYHDYYEKPDQVKRDFLMNYDTLGLKNKIARLPGRNCWQINGRSRSDIEDGKAAADSLAVSGYKVFGWDIEWRYNAAGRLVETASEMFAMVQNMAERKKSFTADNIVILCHDPMLADPYNISALKSFVDLVKLNGNYRFEFLSRYP
ncbi:MAG: polysaccharide deacetylase family protein [Chitinophagales bacterium]